MEEVPTSLRVLVLGSHYAPEPTGNAPYTTGMAAGLAERGHKVAVITTFPHYPQWRVADGYGGWRARESLDDVQLTRVRHYVPRLAVGIRRAAAELSYGAHGVLLPWGRPDVILCVSPALLSTAILLPRALRSAAVGVIAQDLYSAGVEESGGTQAMARAFEAVESWVMRKADGVAVIHDRFKARVTDRLGVSPDRVSVIRNWRHIRAAPPFDREEMRSALGWHQHETIVLHSGAMGQKQDLGNVVEAARVAAVEGAPLRFVLMGHGSQRQALEELGRDVPNLQLIDPLPDDEYVRALHSADILLVNESPSLNETAVPSKLTSYFSAGLPIVAATSDGSTTAEEVTASGAGVVISAGDPAGLVRVVESLRRDTGRAEQLGSRGPSYCDDVLSRRAAIDAYDQWIRQLHVQAQKRKGS